MQVTHASTTITHVGIGGAQSQNFGISDSPEFFQILSSTLYQDQKRAVVRETICNAWDAHIEAGLTHVPLKITLDSNTMAIQDFGHGIPKDKIVPIYGVYGASTKKNDGKQTGGFGLGCKAPFAYTEHFQVTSSHQGERTIYNMSKSSAEAMGRPSITAIASFPTTETGITVSVNIIDSEDIRVFRELIKEITYFGEMLVEFNGKLLPTFPLSTAPHGFIITSQEINSNNSNPRLWVRYGNVVYPIPEHADYSEEYAKIDRHLRTFERTGGWGYARYKIVLMAEPNSIAVTPSRESLSMQEHTINSLRELMRGFKMLDSSKFHNESLKILRAQVDQAIVRNELDELTSTEPKVLYSDELQTADISYIQDEVTAAKHLIARQYPRDCWFKDVEYRMSKLRSIKIEPRGLIKSYHTTIKPLSLKRHITPREERKAARKWFHHNIAKKLYKLAQNNEHIDFDGFRVRDSKLRDSSLGYSEFGNVMPIKHYKPEDITDLLPLLNNFVVIAFPNSVMSRMREFPMLKDKEFKHPYIIYFASPKDKNLDEMREVFKNSNYNIIDLTQTHSWEGPSAQAFVPIPDLPPIPKKPRKTGLPQLSAMVTATGNVLTHVDHTDTPRIQKPEFIFARPGSGQSNRIPGFGTAISTIIAKHFGTLGGMAIGDTQYQRYIQAGAKPVEIFLLDKVGNYIMNSTTIKDDLTFDYNTLGLTYTQNRILDTIFRSDTLSKHYNIVTKTSETDKEYLDIFRMLQSSIKASKAIGLTYSLEDVKKHLENVTIAPSITDLVKKIETSETIKFVDIDEIRASIRRDANTASIPSPGATTALNFLMNAL